MDSEEKTNNAPEMNNEENPNHRSQIRFVMQKEEQPSYSGSMQLERRGGSVFMIVFGAIVTANALSILLYSASFQSAGCSKTSIAVCFAALLAGGLFFLVFGIRKLKKINEHNSQIRWEAKRRGIL